MPPFDGPPKPPIVYCTLGASCTALNPHAGKRGDDPPLSVEHFTCTRCRLARYAAKLVRNAIRRSSTETWRKTFGQVDPVDLRRALCSAAQDPIHVEDVLSDVFERLHGALERGGVAASLRAAKGWLRPVTYRAAMRCSPNAVANRLGMGRDPDRQAAGAHSVPVGAHSVDRRVFHRDFVPEEIVDRAGLSTLERETYDAWRRTELPMADLATVFGCSSGAIRLRLHKTRRKVLRAMAAHFDVDADSVAKILEEDD